MSKASKLKRDVKKTVKKRVNNQKKAEVAQEKQKVPIIYFDESGNTGSNLLDKDQPVFTLASCKFSDEEAQSLIDLLDSKSSHEAHFKRLRKRKSGQDGIVRLMSSSLINKNNIVVNIMLKDFMVVSKIVDILIEHMMFLEGEDLYVNGKNIALSNVLYYCLPLHHDKNLVQLMYNSFVIMIRDQTEENISAFYSSAEEVKNSSIDEKYNKNIELILNTKNCIHDALSGIDKHALDPSIPALFLHCIKWGEIYSKGFHIIHDDSHSINKQKVLFSQFMDLTQSEVEVGYDRRKFKLPLKGRSLKFVNSELKVQLQVADIIASSFAYWAAGVGEGEKEDYLFLKLDEIGLDKFIGNNKIWPTMDITPSDLGTVHDGGLSPANHSAQFLNNAIPNPNF